MSEKSQHIRSRLAYSFGAFGHDAFYATLSTYFIMFITSHLFDKDSGAMGAKMIGYITLIIMALRILELLIDPFIGNAIDNTRTRLGHFKPWILIGGTIGSVVLMILFTNMGGLNTSNPYLYLILFAVLYIMMDIFYSFKDVGFWSMIPAISFDSREREKTATFARVGSHIGQNIVGIVVMPIVLLFSQYSNHGQGDSQGWFAFAVVIGLVSWISAIVVVIGTREKESNLRKNREKTTFKDVLKVLVRNDQLMWVALAYLFYTAGIQIVNAVELYYFTFILGNAAQFSILATINTTIGIFIVLTFPSLAKKFSRRNVFFASVAVLLISILLFTFAGKSLPLVLIAGVLFYIPQPLVFLCVLMIMTDSVEYGQLKFGHRDESLTLSVRPLIDKFGGALTNGFIGIVAVWVGMTSGASAESITAHGQMIFKLMLFGVPAVMLLIACVFFYKKVTLTEEKHAEIVDQLEKTWANKLKNEQAAQLEIGNIDLLIHAPVKGMLMPLDKVADKTFAAGKMGRGFAVKPTEDKVYAPFDGTIETIFPTKHVMIIRSSENALVLIHIGIDTAQMHGDGFTTHCGQGQHVHEGDLLSTFSREKIQKAGFDDTVMVSLTNDNEKLHFEMLKNDGEVDHGSPVLKLRS
ncbi:glycoside-pentoside-hexuronide (GPH):cation symporter [Pectinatus cerevisiiphilus]|uniref:PTS system IIA component (Glc family) n=1 Tax=Pectinatus cerevisiiphilus TaxID=86956 RepID=A0A4V6NYX4_9FIRM|nr:PTS system IIA component (Glc family) [Pectinatus cerevisiiphilus]